MGGNVGTYIHMFWSYPGVARFCIEVVKLINIRLQLTLLTTPMLLLLGIHDDDQRPSYTKLLIYFLLYYARREIMLRWKSEDPPRMTPGTCR